MDAKLSTCCSGATLELLQLGSQVGGVFRDVRPFCWVGTSVDAGICGCKLAAQLFEGGVRHSRWTEGQLAGCGAAAGLPPRAARHARADLLADCGDLQSKSMHMRSRLDKEFLLVDLARILATSRLGIPS